MLKDVYYIEPDGTKVRSIAIFSYRNPYGEWMVGDKRLNDLKQISADEWFNARQRKPTMEVAKWQMEDKAAAVEIDGILAFAIPAVVRQKWPTLEDAVFKAVLDWSESQ